MNPYILKDTYTDEERKELETYSEFLQELLINKGITTKEEADTYLNPNYDEHLHDPFLMKDMSKVVDRLLLAISKNEKIVIYSDYDCDGIPGGVLLHDFFKKIEYKNFENYIPHRHDEGYGLNVSAMEKFGKEGVDVLISVDCGITDVEPVEKANEFNIDVIITDHHYPNGILPPAFAILNPKQEDDSYPYDMLCGTGVAFKLVQALIQKGNFDIKKGWEKWWLDVVGIATIADMVPLTGENRVLAYYGLQVLRKSMRPGILQLCKKMYMKQFSITEDDVGFMIAPRINAASRMDVPMDAFKLLSTNDELEAGMLSTHLDKINNQRKGMVGAITREVKKRIEDGGGEVGEVIVMGNPDWKPPLLGIVANNISEIYKRPTFFWGRDGGTHLKGSCRSGDNTNVMTLMSGVPEGLFLNFGGHAFSGGFSTPHERIHELEAELLKAYAAIDKNTEEVSIFIDKKLSLNDVSWDTYRELEKMMPFGQENIKPLFLFENIQIRDSKDFGKEKNHLQIDFEKEFGGKVSAIGFFKTVGDYGNKLEQGNIISLVATIEKSTFGRTNELRLRIVDIV
ncbi:single-stranded-DNA-specific exonuclease RecJ [Candidatus Kaiserbacteria bacterium]|nr:single-stranded-DNA-specific exonuclease RecJ [Candidatus Kaiserbacteria bacterium]